MAHTTAKPATAGSANDHPFMTVQQAADALGYSHMTIRRRIELGSFPAIRMGSKAMVPRAFINDVVAAAMTGRTVTIEDFAAEWSATAAGEAAS
ncbi:excisionase family DNA binding protein [Murinocardiopsis flavida]|uniref:Excisionase family DNA binding protein n=1 Tax=Murinocardiopsis flavida TaxID=645275 RepID=A0A2P8DFN5_9ACTN|nr:excisionase family DNA-binding protein [Murinocardiopsis flavida]PSK96025.1 excisionase family DNA binding protein [Murinocardiopsis flavida]